MKRLGRWAGPSEDTHKVPISIELVPGHRPISRYVY
jgi:hypothetical protein